MESSNAVRRLYAVNLSAEEAGLLRSLLSKILAAPGPTAFEKSDEKIADRAEQDNQTLARAIYRCRKRRSQHFSASLFSEPAWDMLLALFVFEESKGEISVSRLADLIECPLTTAIRWLDYLESQRLITRSQCPADRRKFVVRLSDKGRRLMNDYLRSMRESETAILRG